MKALHPLLDRLTSELTNRGSPIAEELRPGLVDETVVRMLEAAGLHPAPAALSLFTWRNGSNPAAASEFIMSLRFVSLEEALAERSELISEFVNPASPVAPEGLFKDTWLPVFVGRLRFAIETEPGSNQSDVLELWWDSPTRWIGGGIDTLLAGQILALERGSHIVGEDGSIRTAHPPPRIDEP